MKKYQFMIRETFTDYVEIESDSFEEAREEIEKQYENEEFSLDRNCFAGAEIRLCCSECSSDFDEDERELVETSDGKMLCRRCAEKLKGEFA